MMDKLNRNALVACVLIGSSAYLISTGHPWWAFLFFIIATDVKF